MPTTELPTAEDLRVFYAERAAWADTQRDRHGNHFPYVARILESGPTEDEALAMVAAIPKMREANAAATAKLESAKRRLASVEAEIAAKGEAIATARENAEQARAAAVAAEIERKAAEGRAAALAVMRRELAEREAEQAKADALTQVIPQAEARGVPIARSRIEATIYADAGLEYVDATGAAPVLIAGR